ncbi:MAG: [protein-PII] uridylyltransferase [Sphingomonadaceae bacterium]|nr:[protein-PII] uridylyltransferase [Sphingomonadaceae bacterium]
MVDSPLFSLASVDLGNLPDGPALRSRAARLLKAGLERGRAELAARAEAQPGAGACLARDHATLMDGLLRLLAGFVAERLHPHGAPTAFERLAIIAVGGYGRGELAPHSDIDVLFVTPGRPSPWTEQVIESTLYALWDIGPKLGHAVRSLDELVRVAKTDLTVRTALLEGRLIWGDAALSAQAFERFRREVVQPTAARFIADKLAERSERHRKLGDSRYVVEPNLKDGKGGLRDIQTLFWIGRYLHRNDVRVAMVRERLLSASELKTLERAERFFWAVRWQLHSLAGRAEERVTFDMQPELARRLRYQDRPGMSGAERFMRHYFLHAREVGALTGVFLTQLEERFGSRGWLPPIMRRPKALMGFALRRGRVTAPSDGWFKDDPTRLLSLFAAAEANALEVDPGALRLAARDSGLIDERVRSDRQANVWFLQVLTSPRDSETLLRQMNECGVFGRFVPDFGRVAAKMQWDMYHHFTVDEHTIRAIGLLSRVERGSLASDYPLASRIAHQLSSRRALYVAVLLHDIAKGRKGDHSILGAEIAETLCPRLGLTPAETETVAWAVRWHLLMSATAFKRDLSDPETIAAFASAVGSLERLRLLTVLTTVDISAVGPGVWTRWKAQLIAELYERAEERLRLGHMEHGRRAAVVAARQARLGAALGWSAAETEAYAANLPDSYWVAEPADVIEANARLIADCRAGRAVCARSVADPAAGATQIAVYAPDTPGLFARLAGAIALSGASVVDARIHTTADGRALDNFTVADPLGGPFDEPRRLRRVEALIEAAVTGQLDQLATLRTRPLPRRRAAAFSSQPSIYLSNKISSRFTVAEVGALDRPGLLHDLTDALHRFGATVRSAHIATYGARANDVFYLVDARGRRITDPSELDALERALARAAAGEIAEAAA